MNNSNKNLKITTSHGWHTNKNQDQTQNKEMPALTITQSQILQHKYRQLVQKIPEKQTIQSQIMYNNNRTHQVLNKKPDLKTSSAIQSSKIQLPEQSPIPYNTEAIIENLPTLDRSALIKYIIQNNELENTKKQLFHYKSQFINDIKANLIKVIVDHYISNKEDSLLQKVDNIITTHFNTMSPENRNKYSGIIKKIKQDIINLIDTEYFIIKQKIQQEQYNKLEQIQNIKEELLEEFNKSDSLMLDSSNITEIQDEIYNLHFSQNNEAQNLSLNIKILCNTEKNEIVKNILNSINTKLLNINKSYKDGSVVVKNHKFIEEWGNIINNGINEIDQCISNSAMDYDLCKRLKSIKRYILQTLKYIQDKSFKIKTLTIKNGILSKIIENKNTNTANHNIDLIIQSFIIQNSDIDKQSIERIIDETIAPKINQHLNELRQLIFKDIDAMTKNNINSLIQNAPYPLLKTIYQHLVKSLLYKNNTDNDTMVYKSKHDLYIINDLKSFQIDKECKKFLNIINEVITIIQNTSLVNNNINTASEERRNKINQILANISKKDKENQYFTIQLFIIIFFKICNFKNTENECQDTEKTIYKYIYDILNDNKPLSNNRTLTDIMYSFTYNVPSYISAKLKNNVYNAITAIMESLDKFSDAVLTPEKTSKIEENILQTLEKLVINYYNFVTHAQRYIIKEYSEIASLDTQNKLENISIDEVFDKNSTKQMPIIQLQENEETSTKDETSEHSWLESISKNKIMQRRLSQNNHR
ncbi:hypothetical protein [Candidatus Deianiraea vastatrix]|uniref:Uncharacterized protein n=1 Tax=Candidatus Deianiraea vastatrix TaxID=2163644 RepID=A0A5B8XFH1_9RICK|nr:hypothetical protein [Candidatus Deianiraea vastatrix]QED23134.1 hypothetical protein Deia_00328 [Candidatus Deianiraea vastatrix]